MRLVLTIIAAAIAAVLAAGCAADGLPISGADDGTVGVPDGGSRHPADLAVHRDGGGLPDFGPSVDLASAFDMAPSPPGDMAPTSAPCLTGGSVIYLDGDPDDWIHPGAETIQVPSWSAVNSGSSDTF